MLKLKRSPCSGFKLERLIGKILGTDGRNLVSRLEQEGLIERGESGMCLTSIGMNLPLGDDRSKLDAPQAYRRPLDPEIHPAYWWALVSLRGREVDELDFIQKLGETDLDINWRVAVTHLIKRKLVRRTEKSGRVGLSDVGKRMLSPELKGREGRWHRWMTCQILSTFQWIGWHTFVCFERKGPGNPDIIVTPLFWGRWDYSRQFVVEIETDPVKHPDNVRNNFRRDLERGWPVLFAVMGLKHREAIIRALRGESAKLVKVFNTVQKIENPFGELRNQTERAGHFAICVEQPYGGLADEELLGYCKRTREQVGVRFTIKHVKRHPYLYAQTQHGKEQTDECLGRVGSEFIQRLEDEGLIRRRSKRWK